MLIHLMFAPKLEDEMKNGRFYNVEKNKSGQQSNLLPR